MSKTSQDSNAPNTLQVSLQTHQPTIEAFTTVTALNMYPLISKVTAQVQDPKNTFIPGQAHDINATLLQLDDTDLRFNYYAQKSTLIKLVTQLLADFKLQFPARVSIWKQFLSNYSIEAPLPPLPKNESTKEKNYLSAKNIYNTYYSLRQIEVQLSNYRFVAPFKGNLLSPTVSHLDMVQSGQTLGYFIGDTTYKAEIMIPLTQRNTIQVGNKVVLTHSLTNTNIQTTIKSLSSSLDQESRTITAYVEFESTKECHNLVFDVTIIGQALRNIAIIPRQYVREGVVFVETAQGTNEQAVTIEHIENNNAIVRGLRNNQQLQLPPQ